jgi:hypothetical protein
MTRGFHFASARYRTVRAPPPFLSVVISPLVSSTKPGWRTTQPRSLQHITCNTVSYKGLQPSELGKTMYIIHSAHQASAARGLHIKMSAAVIPWFRDPIGMGPTGKPRNLAFFSHTSGQCILSVLLCCHGRNYALTTRLHTMRTFVSTRAISSSLPI